MDEFETPDGTILLAYRGSIAHGMYVPNSDPDSIDDVDLIGFLIPEAKYYIGLSEWGSRGTQDYWRGRYDYVFYELRKAVSLLLRGNPNVVSVLWLRPEHYLFLSDAGRALLDHRHLFVGKHVYDAFAGYAQTQLEKMETRDPAELREYMGVTAELKARGLHPNHKGEHIPASPGHPRDYASWSPDKLLQRLESYRKKGENIGYMGEKRKSLVLRHGYDAKNAAHCIRLLRMCKEFLATGEMEVYRSRDAEELLDIKRGKWCLDEVKQHARELFDEIAAARDASPLPEGPDRQAVERLLVELIASRL